MRRPKQMRNGEKLFSSVIVKVFKPGNKQTVTFLTKSTANTLFRPENVMAILSDIVEKVEKDFPDDEFNLVPLGANRFNIVWAAKKQMEATA